jgi:hypothetical protein
MDVDEIKADQEERTARLEREIAELKAQRVGAPPYRTVGLAGAGVVVLAAFLPWVSAIFASKAGVEGDGVITLVLGGLAGLMAWKMPRQWANVLVGLAGITVSSIALLDANHISQLASERDIAVTIGMGLWLTALGGIVLVGGAFLGNAAKRSAAESGPSTARRAGKYVGTRFKRKHAIAVIVVLALVGVGVGGAALISKRNQRQATESAQRSWNERAFAACRTAVDRHLDEDGTTFPDFGDEAVSVMGEAPGPFSVATWVETDQRGRTDFACFIRYGNIADEWRLTEPLTIVEGE